MDLLAEDSIHGYRIECVCVYTTVLLNCGF